MSLLQQINERNQAQQQEKAASQELASRPDAGVMAAEKSSQQSADIARMPDQELQEEQPTGEEQEQFTQLEGQAIQIINEPQSGDAMLKAIMDSPDVVKGVASASSDITRAIKQRNPEASPEILFAVGESVVEMVVDLLEKANPQVDLSDEEIAESFGEAVQLYMKDNPDSVDADTSEYLNQTPPKANLGAQ